MTFYYYELMLKKLALFLTLFLAVIILLSPKSVSAETCCGDSRAPSGFGASDPKLCYDAGALKCSDFKDEAIGINGLRPCNVTNNKTADTNGDGTEETYNSDCFIAINAPSEVRITDFGKLFTGAVSFLLLIAFILAFFFLILGGISWLTSGGDKAAVETARNKIIAAIIGLIIVAATWAIFQLVGGAIGFNILSGFTIPRLF